MSISAADALRTRASGLRTMQVLYFIFFAGNGIFFTYINVYYKSLGFTGTQIGIINTFVPLAGILGMTTFGVLNDRSHQTRLLLMAAIAGAALAALGISAAPAFAWIVPIACVYTFVVNPIIPLLDTTTIGLLGEHRQRYGVHRVWGSAGFILTAAIVGEVLERTGMGGMFPLYAGLMGCLFVASWWLPATEVHLGGFSLRGLGAMLRQPGWLIFTFSVFLLGLSFSGIFGFLSVTVRTMGGSEALIGLSWTVAALPEIPVMLFGPQLLRRIGGQRLVAIAFVMYFARNLLYSLMPSPLWVLPINLIFGSSFALYWIGAMNYLSETARPGLRTTAQSLLTSSTSLANVIGALFCGWLFDTVAPSGMFRVLSVFSLLAVVVLLAGQRATRPAAPA